MKQVATNESSNKGETQCTPRTVHCAQWKLSINYDGKLKALNCRENVYWMQRKSVFFCEKQYDFTQYGTRAKKIADLNEKIGSREMRSRTNCIEFVLIEEIQFKVQ